MAGNKNKITCKHCGAKDVFVIHTRWCASNPRAQEYRDRQSAHLKSTRKTSEFVDAHVKAMRHKWETDEEWRKSKIEFYNYGKTLRWLNDKGEHSAKLKLLYSSIPELRKILSLKAVECWRDTEYAFKVIFNQKKYKKFSREKCRAIWNCKKLFEDSNNRKNFSYTILEDIFNVDVYFTKEKIAFIFAEKDTLANIDRLKKYCKLKKIKLIVISYYEFLNPNLMQYVDEAMKSTEECVIL